MTAKLIPASDWNAARFSPPLSAQDLRRLRQSTATTDSERADGINKKWKEVSDEELERLARKAGLLGCIDDAYLARGDWLP